MTDDDELQAALAEVERVHAIGLAAEEAAAKVVANRPFQPHSVGVRAQAYELAVLDGIELTLRQIGALRD
jgi:hypothetical protein